MSFYDIKGIEKRNWVKLKCLYCLAHYRKQLPGTLIQGLSLHDLAHYTNSSRGSLYTLTKRWYRWGLVKWWKVPVEDRTLGYEYYFSSTARGEAYLKRAYGWYSLIHQVEDEVDTSVKLMNAWAAGDFATINAIKAGSD